MLVSRVAIALPVDGSFILPDEARGAIWLFAVARSDHASMLAWSRPAPCGPCIGLLHSFRRSWRLMAASPSARDRNDGRRPVVLGQRAAVVENLPRVRSILTRLRLPEVGFATGPRGGKFSDRVDCIHPEGLDGKPLRRMIDAAGPSARVGCVAHQPREARRAVSVTHENLDHL